MVCDKYYKGLKELEKEGNFKVVRTTDDLKKVDPKAFGCIADIKFPAHAKACEETKPKNIISATHMSIVWMPPDEHKIHFMDNMITGEVLIPICTRGEGAKLGLADMERGDTFRTIFHGQMPEYCDITNVHQHIADHDEDPECGATHVHITCDFSKERYGHPPITDPEEIGRRMGEMLNQIGQFAKVTCNKKGER